MLYVFIAWAPDSPELTRLSDELKAAFEALGFSVGGRSAAAASIMDIAAADLVLFGVGRSDSEYPAEYSDLVRVFSGANLAGKAAACFAAGAPRASAGLRRHLSGTGISLYQEELGPVEKASKGGEAREWAARVAGFLEGKGDGRR